MSDAESLPNDTQAAVRKVMAEHAFCQGLADDHIDRLVDIARPRAYQEGEVVFQEGEDAGGFYLVTRGRVAFDLEIPGRGFTTVETIGPGDVMGWSWLIPPHRWSFSARALELTRTIVLDATKLRALCGEHHDLGYEVMFRLLRVVSQRLNGTRIQLLDLYQAPPHG